jgi:phage protein D
MSSQPIPIYQDRDFYVPQFLVKVGNRPLDREVIHDIISVSYRDNIKEFDSFEISISNWDSEARDFKYSDQDLFLPGKSAELWMGYRGQDELRLMLTGEITSLRPTFPAGGQPTLTLSGRNLLHQFQRRKESHAYQNMKDSEIARQIADDRLGVEIDTDSQAEKGEHEHKFLFQHNQYDIIFLMERARRIGYELVVQESGENGESEESSLYFGPPEDVRDDIYKLEYGKSLIEFQPTLTVGNQVAQVTVRGWNPVQGEAIEVTVTRDGIDNQGVGEEGGQQQISRAFSENQEIITDQPIESEEEARTLARSTLEDIAREMVKGSGSTLGLPDLRAGRYLRIEGLGKRFSGRYFVTATTHSIGAGGYKTQFECRREETKD